MKIKSFTLIELLVVIVIIGILAGVIIVSTSSSISKANFAKAQAFSNTVQQELLLNLVSEWTFDEGNAEDSWGNNDGVVTGATYQNKASGKCVYGGCYSFDGNDYISIANKENLNFKTDLSISLWIKSPANTIISKTNTSNGTGNNPNYVMDVVSGGVVRFFGYTSGIAKGITAGIGKNYNDGNWHHIVGTFNGTIWKLYGDGSFDVSVEDVCNLESSDFPLYIGARDYNYSFYGGLIDDVRIYNAALSTAQIKQDYIAGLNSLLANNKISKEEYNQRLESLSINY